jgi:hypothetical protein
MKQTILVVAVIAVIATSGWVVETIASYIESLF